MTGTLSARWGIYGALDRVLRTLEVGAAIIGGVAMVAAMVLTSMDAVLRYLFNAPLSFNSYLTTYYLMVAMLVMPLAWAFRTGGYIRVVFLVSLLPPKLGAALLRIGKLVGAGYFGALAWLSGQTFWKIYQAGDIQMGAIDWPVAWSWVWLPMGLGLLSLRMLLMVFGPADELHYADWVNKEAQKEPV